MAPRFSFRLVTPTGVIFEGPVEAASAVGPLGEFGVLAQHIDFITSLNPGVLTLARGGNSFEHFVIPGGLAEVRGGAMTVLADSAEPAAELDRGPLLRELEAAEERLGHRSFYEVEYESAARAVQLARARLRAADLAAR